MNCRLPLLLALSAATLSGCVFHIGGDWDDDDWGRSSYIRGNGVEATETRDIEDFDAVRVEDSIDLVVRVGEPTSLSLRGDENLLEHVVTRVRNGRLEIEMDHGGYRSRRGLLVELSTPALLAVRISGSSDVVIEDAAGDELELRISGSGDIHATGAVERLSVKISGSGDMHLYDLTAREASVSISGSGDVRTSVSELLEARISGSGDIRYRGAPACSLSVSGSGSIRSD
ncbi:MAG: DUF2807 domain-containing protein [Planctomycetota bacterium]|nr:MAG: DUF2807 domain-containing protein [Planctomycetota bacterium]